MDKVFFNIFIILIETIQTFFLPLNIIRLYKKSVCFFNRSVTSENAYSENAKTALQFFFCRPYSIYKTLKIIVYFFKSFFLIFDLVCFNYFDSLCLVVQQKGLFSTKKWSKNISEVHKFQLTYILYICCRYIRTSGHQDIRAAFCDIQKVSDL